MFADAVREAQAMSQIDDAVAHHLALLAMDQFGLLLAGMNPGLVTASSELEIAERGWQHRGIVWLPSRMVMADETIPKNWQVTSDSLSAWIANKIGSEHLLLIKSRTLAAYTSPVATQALIADGLIDSAFVDFNIKADFQTWVLNKSDYDVFSQGLDLTKLRQLAVSVSKA